MVGEAISLYGGWLCPLILEWCVYGLEEDPGQGNQNGFRIVREWSGLYVQCAVTTITNHAHTHGLEAVYIL